jgi:hypothetical protein
MVCGGADPINFLVCGSPNLLSFFFCCIVVFLFGWGVLHVGVLGSGPKLA